jgi:hypothetical protein
MNEYNPDLDKEIEEGIARAERMLRRQKILWGIGITALVLFVFVLAGVLFFTFIANQAVQAQRAATAQVLQAQGTGTARVLQAQATGTAQVLQDQATGTAQVLQAQGTATAQALQAQRTATARALQTQGTATARAQQAQSTSTARAKNTQLQNYQYYDPFNDNKHNWLVGDADNDFWRGSRTINNGILSWKVDEAKKIFVSRDWFWTETNLKDFDVALKARRQAGSAVSHCYGLSFRETDGKYYLFTVCEDGIFMVDYKGEEWETIEGWTSTSAIHENDWNLLEVSARGSQFTLFINHQQIYQFTDTRLPQGDVSLSISIFEEKPGRIDFDFFALQPR